MDNLLEKGYDLGVVDALSTLLPLQQELIAMIIDQGGEELEGFLAQVLGIADVMLSKYNASLDRVSTTLKPTSNEKVVSLDSRRK